MVFAGIRNGTGWAPEGALTGTIASPWSYGAMVQWFRTRAKARFPGPSKPMELLVQWSRTRAKERFPGPSKLVDMVAPRSWHAWFFIIISH